MGRLFVKRVILYCLLLSACLYSCRKTEDKKTTDTAIELKSLNTGSEDKSAEPGVSQPGPQTQTQPEPGGQKESQIPADNNKIADVQAVTSASPSPTSSSLTAESIVPGQIRRPRLGESVRYPADSVISSLGAGEASPEAYHFAQKSLQGLLQEKNRKGILSGLASDEAERIADILGDFNPEKVRIGGGREEPDGSVSFLLRFIGKSHWAAGELYIRQKGNNWNLEDLILDRPGDSGGGREQYRFNFPPYERFF